MTDIGADFVTVSVRVHLYPKFEAILNKETGVVEPRLVESVGSKKAVDLLLDPKGNPLYPQNIYLHSLKSRKHLTSTKTHALALLAFSRWMVAVDLTYRSLTDEPGEGVVWKFADYLIDNLRIIDPETGETDNPDGYAISTARAYMLCIIDFYKWLHSEGCLIWTSRRRPFAIVHVRKEVNQNPDTHILSHTRRNQVVYVQTTDIMKRFPKVQSVMAHEKLKPMRADHKSIFETLLESISGTKALMWRVVLETGLRLQELVTLPDSQIVAPKSEVMKISIGPANGCGTKYRKQREIEIPFELMQTLYEYKASDERQESLARIGISLNAGLQQEPSCPEGVAHGRLFVSNKGRPFAKNTLQTFFAKLRKEIRQDIPDWYYRPHDVRSTFATYWLLDQQGQRDVLYDFLINELAALMGHENTVTTQKYIDFMQARSQLLEHSARKNAQAAKALRRIE